MILRLIMTKLGLTAFFCSYILGPQAVAQDYKSKYRAGYQKYEKYLGVTQEIEVFNVSRNVLGVEVRYGGVDEFPIQVGHFYKTKLGYTVLLESDDGHLLVHFSESERTDAVVFINMLKNMKERGFITNVAMARYNTLFKKNCFPRESDECLKDMSEEPIAENSAWGLGYQNYSFANTRRFSVSSLECLKTGVLKETAQCKINWWR